MLRTAIGWRYHIHRDSFILINDSFRILIYVNDQNPHRIKNKPIYKNVHQTTKHTATASIKLVYQNVHQTNNDSKHKPIYKNVHQTTKHTATASIKLVYQNVPPNNQTYSDSKHKTRLSECATKQSTASHS